MIVRQGNWLGQGRIDAPHIRALESSVAADFDILAGQMMAGKKALVLKGMNITTTGAIGAQATLLQLNVPNALIMHYGASESGTIFWVPGTRDIEVLNLSNPRLQGSFTASQTNYIGLDMSRSADADTSDSVQFIDAATLRETGKNVPLARTLDYRIVVGTTNFSSQPTILPIAKVVTDPLNNVVSIQDARQMMFRLATGSDFPDIQGAYTWPGTRSGNVAGDVFAGGDKSIDSLKVWMDAIMTRLWDLGGGEYWYSATADRNVNMVWVGATFTNGENFEWDGTHLHWKGLRFLFDNSTGYYNDIADQTGNSAGLTDLADGECIYADLDRTQNLTGGSALVAVKSALTLLGASAVPGARQVLAWRVGSVVYSRFWRYPVGTTFIPATTTSTGVLKITRDYTGAEVAGPSGLNSPIAISDRGGYILTVVGSNQIGLEIIAEGSGDGLVATGGPSGIAVGVRGTGGTNKTGGFFTGNGTGYGAKGIGGATDGAYGGYFGVLAVNSTALIATGAGTGHGGEFIAGATGKGISATSTGGTAVYGASSASIGGDFTGVTAAGGTAALRGVGGVATVGVLGTGGTSGSGGVFTGGTLGKGVVAVGNGGGSGIQASSAVGLGGDFSGGSTAAVRAIGLAGCRGILAEGGSASSGGEFLGGSGSGRGVLATGTGTGTGGEFIGGLTATYALVGTADALGNGNGGHFTGYGTGLGLRADSGPGADAIGLFGVSTGTGNAYGVKGTSAAGAGMFAQGSGTAVGLVATSAAAEGITAQGGTDKSGVQSRGAGAGHGVEAYGGTGGVGVGLWAETGSTGATGRAIRALGHLTGDGALIESDGTGYGLIVQSPVAAPARSAFRMVPQAAPTVGLIGDMYMSVVGKVYVCTNAAGPVWTQLSQTPPNL